MPTKSYRPWLPGHPTLLPTDLRRWLPNEHLVWFVLELVERLDVAAIEERIQAKDPRGTQPYDPRMMTALLIYAYAVGVFSSRRIERATYEDVAFRVLTADQQPDHDTIATFRRENLDALRELFVQVLRLAATMGLVSFGALGLDGVKILANASKHQAMSYARMKQEIERLRAEIDELLRRAEQTDSEEQVRFGDGQLADLPAEIARREDRKAKIEAAMRALEAEAREARLAELREQAERHEQGATDETRDEKLRRTSATLAAKRRAAIAALEAGDADDEHGEAADEHGDGEAADEDDVEHDDDDAPGPDAMPSHQVPHHRDGTPKDNAQRNFTDPESRIMVRDGDHVVQAFNAQALVDNAHQIVVAADVGNQSPDVGYLAPMLARADGNLEAAGIAKPAKMPLAADTGFYSEANVAVAEARGYDPYIAVERSKRVRLELLPAEPAPAPTAADPPPPMTPARATRERMRAKLQTPEGARIYGLRKTTPEPVFGQILEVRGFRRFLLRGLRKVRGEWSLVTMTHNVLKLWRSGAELPAPA
jgi:transposase